MLLKKVRRGLSRLSRTTVPSKKPVEEQPLRAELFSREQFEQHAIFLAKKHTLRTKKGAEKLLPRLHANKKVLLRTYQLLSGAGKAKREIAPAGEWLLDNYYLIEEQIRLAQKHLPKGYSRELPTLLKGPLAGLPRVYDLAMEMVSHGDGKLDVPGLTSFVAAYQTIQHLRLGELWAIPIMLRLALIENLRRVSTRMMLSQSDCDQAEYWASRILAASERDSDDVVLEIAEMSKLDLPLSTAFVAEFVRRLHGQSSTLNLPLAWLEKRLSERGITIDQLIQSASQKQAADQVSIANTIESLRLLGVTPWQDFVETLSIVEHIFFKDPTGTYRSLDFATRDRYRHVVEKLAVRSRLEEQAVASKVVHLAAEAQAQKGHQDVTAHVGYWLIDLGLETLYRSLALPFPQGEYLQAKKTTLPLMLYLGSIALLSGIVTFLLLLLAWSQGLVPGLLGFSFFALPLLLITSQIAITKVNWLATLWVTPQRLPRMDYSEGIPADAHTLVIIPSMLSSQVATEALIENLEVRYLGNTDPNVDFGLLTDFQDAEVQTTPEDAALLGQVRDGIEALNHKYRWQQKDIFYLFHRPRTWNAQEKNWMGYERKRGKLSALNKVLRGGETDQFDLIIGDLAPLQDVKYVITLDADTQMPRDVARNLVGIIAHPLNRPYYDAEKARVTRGYGILQPRVEGDYPSKHASLFVKIFGGDSGIDPYTKAVSNVYQDLFFEGSFIGKGLYDVDAFEQSVSGRFPENQVLSHDLLEGCHARSALVTDVQLYEAYPATYLKDSNRRHRWIRGDWQIARSLLSKNVISLLSKWKIFDNLRRSLVPIALAWLLMFGWLLLESTWLWTLAILALWALPVLLTSLFEFTHKSYGISIRSHVQAAISSLALQTSQLFLSLTFLLYEAAVNLDAILTSLWRMTISHRHLLEWEPFKGSQSLIPSTLAHYYRRMLFAPTVILVIASYLAAARRLLDPLSLLLGCVWLLSPWVAFVISRPSPTRPSQLSGSQVSFLRKQARRTWSYFETFVTEQSNYLPPDNYQEEHVKAVASRTSPTNIGLSLLATLAAYDFGYLSMGGMFSRTEKTLTTLSSMDKFKRHFYNWYNTETLQPLEPLYISSVDSGNLIGHLLVLHSGLMEMPNHPIASPRIIDGLRDTLEVALESLLKPDNNLPLDRLNALTPVVERLQSFQAKLAASPTYLSELHTHLRQLLRDTSKIMPDLVGQDFRHTKMWLQTFERQCYDHLEELSYIAPWILLAPDIPGMWNQEDPSEQERLTALGAELRALDEIPTLGSVARLEYKLLPILDGVLKNYVASGNNDAAIAWLTELRSSLQLASTRASERIAAIGYLALRCNEMSAVEYEFLYDKKTHLLSIGYNVREHKADPACYDLLASEARLGSFVAIAQGKMPQEHWFKLGRLLTKYGGDTVLVSWGGSMFEYLMPLLVMPTYEGTLLDNTYRSAISRQIDYAGRNNIPWGISESGYNKIDAAMIYQYRSFGVPDTGFKRGLGEDLVVAPYASALALMVEPAKACANLERLQTEGFGGEYGFYEAIDYTPSRLATGQTHAVIRSYMAHHQGMSLLSFAYTLLDKPMQKRFLADPMFKATELLLQERIPKAIPYLYDLEVTGKLRKTAVREMLLRVFTDPGTVNPETHLLSNGHYNVMLTQAGGGYSRWKDLALTRWQEDAALDNAGSFIYIKDVKTGEFWSTTHQPTLKESTHYEAIFSQSRAEFKRRDHEIETHTQVATSPEDDIELRRVKLTNRSQSTRIIELTSYAEAVLNQPAADLAHRAFSNLFVQTEIVKSHQAILCSRRPRSEQEHFPLLLHLMAVHGNSIVDASYETDRAKFIGRGKTQHCPEALEAEGPLSNTEGSVLDPIVAIRCRIALEPDESATIDYVMGVCPDRAAADKTMEKYRNRGLADRVFDLAWTHGQVALHQIDATEADAQLYGRLASAILYASAEWRAPASLLKQNLRGQSDLWGHSISGDLPIVLVRIEYQENIDLIAQMVQAHSYWRMKGLAVDLVIWNEDRSVYRDSMSERITGLISAVTGKPSDQQGGIFLRRPDQMSEEDRILMQTVARVIISDKGGTLSEQLDYIARQRPQRPLLIPTKKTEPSKAEEGLREHTDLTYFNGLGGFAQGGREYLINSSESKKTPAPWVNLLANREFGTVISESGSAYTWSENAHEFRLTPWGNDPITDSSGEALYIRDEETGKFWSPTPLPAGGKLPFLSRHGFGYSVFEHQERGIASELTVFVALEHPVKLSILKLKNASGRKRRLTLTTYHELVMGTQRDKSHMHIVTEVDPKSGGLLAYNHFNKEFPNRVVFHDSSRETRFVSGDRIEFLGRNGTLASPDALHRDRLSGKTGAGLDPCAALQVSVELDVDEEKEIMFQFGAGKSLDDARATLQYFSDPTSITRELEKVKEFWQQTLGAIQIETPDDSINYLVNGWLQYQTISARLWGRSGFYQSGGAYGFRDQLQDVMCLMHSEPAMVREYLLTFASHQFLLGDVQHWWHPPANRGVRTHCSDDYLWLPLVTALYVDRIGDTGVLNELVPWLEGPELRPEEESRYDRPTVSENTGTLYEHCVAAVEHALRFGVRGLPLIGGGDWNDGMNKVGHEGKGESVWLAFFLYSVLQSMEKVATLRGDTPFAETCRKEAAKLSQNIETHAWDGAWYHRAYFDDGNVLGSAKNSECRIDSLPQSWAVISGAVSQERAKMAMSQVDQLLVNRRAGLIRLFTPAFDTGESNPGYIKGYVPGVRENGGQYTHAAVWAVMAFAMLGDGERAWELLNLINPIRHADSKEKSAVYKVEPYVLAADVYDLTANAGRGGWTWYTGSASWMYQLIVDTLLGIRLAVDRLIIEPCLPKAWPSLKLHYRYKATLYHISYVRSGPNNGVTSITVDGVKQAGNVIPLINDRAEHEAEVVVG